MCSEHGHRPGTPEYRNEWLERRHEQMVERIAEMNHERNLANARAERLERALQHIALHDETPTINPQNAELAPPGWVREFIRCAKNALSEADEYVEASS